MNNRDLVKSAAADRDSLRAKAAGGLELVKSGLRLGRAILGGNCSETEQQKRRDLCASCEAVDAKGERIFRTISGAQYCGEPKTRRPIRDDTASGCGCEMSIKWRLRRAGCPLGRWHPAEV